MTWSSYDRTMATISAVLGERLANAFDYAVMSSVNPDAVSSLPVQDSLSLLLLYSLITEDAGSAVIALNLLIMTENTEYDQLLLGLCEEFGFQTAELEKAQVFASNLPISGVRAIFNEIAFVISKMNHKTLEHQESQKESPVIVENDMLTCERNSISCQVRNIYTGENSSELRQLQCTINPEKRLKPSVKLHGKRKVRKKDSGGAFHMHDTIPNIDMPSNLPTNLPIDYGNLMTNGRSTATHQDEADVSCSGEQQVLSIVDSIVSDEEIEQPIGDKLICSIKSLGSNVPMKRLLIIAEHAIQMGNIAAIRLLRRKGLDLTWCFGPERYTCLHLAAKYGHKDLVQYFLMRGVDVDGRTRGGWTPLVMAVEANNLSMVQLLVISGADLYACDSKLRRTPLHWAAWYNMLEIAQFLLNHSKAHEQKDINGHTPLDLCRHWGYKEMEELIIHSMALDTIKSEPATDVVMPVDDSNPLESLISDC